MYDKWKDVNVINRPWVLSDDVTFNVRASAQRFPLTVHLLIHHSHQWIQNTHTHTHHRLQWNVQVEMERRFSQCHTPGAVSGWWAGGGAKLLYSFKTSSNIPRTGRGPHLFALFFSWLGGLKVKKLSHMRVCVLKYLVTFFLHFCRWCTPTGHFLYSTAHTATAAVFTSKRNRSKLHFDEFNKRKCSWMLVFFPQTN